MDVLVRCMALSSFNIAAACLYSLSIIMSYLCIFCLLLSDIVCLISCSSPERAFEIHRRHRTMGTWIFTSVARNKHDNSAFHFQMIHDILNASFLPTQLLLSWCQQRFSVFHDTKRNHYSRKLSLASMEDVIDRTLEGVLEPWRTLSLHLVRLAPFSYWACPIRWTILKDVSGFDCSFSRKCQQNRQVKWSFRT